jgi:hypothetical protein
VLFPLVGHGQTDEPTLLRMPLSWLPRKMSTTIALIEMVADRADSSLLPQGSKRRKTATAFCPPNPNPLTMAVSTRRRRATSGT